MSIYFRRVFLLQGNLGASADYANEYLLPQREDCIQDLEDDLGVFA